MFRKTYLLEIRERKRSEFVRNFVLFISAILLSYTILFYSFDYTIASSYTGISILIILSAYLFVSRMRLSFSEVVRIALIWAFLLIYIMTLVAWKAFPFIFFWYFPIIIAHLITKTSYRAFIYWVVLILVLSLSAPVVSTLFEINYKYGLNEYQNRIASYFTVFFNFCLIAFLLYYINIFQKINIFIALVSGRRHSQNEETMKDYLSRPALNEANNEAMEGLDKKLAVLYNRTEIYFADSKPFVDPDYTINKLAAHFNTNVTYISKALNSIKNVNFKTYLNIHRVRYIKEKLDRFEHEKFTLKHIYNDAGFLHQTTFNRAFREIEGMTPSEYIENLKRNISN